MWVVLHIAWEGLGNWGLGVGCFGVLGQWEVRVSPGGHFAHPSALVITPDFLSSRETRTSMYFA